MQNYEIEHLNQVLNPAAECTLFLKKNGEFPLKSPGKIEEGLEKVYEGALS